MHGGGEGDKDSQKDEEVEILNKRREGLGVQAFLPLHQLPCMEVERERPDRCLKTKEIHRDN